MDIIKRTVPVTQLLLILPAALFMIALIVRGAGPVPYEPAYAAQQIVMWYSGRVWTLWVLLIALPLVVLGIGCLVLRNNWSAAGQPRHALAALHADCASWFVTTLTLAAGIILVIVAVHMMMN